MPSTEKVFIKVPAFNDHTACKGHQNFVLDCEYTSQEDRDLLSMIIENYISPNKNK